MRIWKRRKKKEKEGMKRKMEKGRTESGENRRDSRNLILEEN